MLPCFKKKNHEKIEDEEAKSAVQFTFYDQHGILRKGIATDDGLLHNRDEELERVLTMENGWAEFSEEEKRTWYIVESGWIRTWLSYVRYGTASLGDSLSSPAPPSINNECLLLMTADIEASEEAKKALQEKADADDSSKANKKRKSVRKSLKPGDALPDPEGYVPRFKWVCKAGLLPASKDGQGHFRRVNCKVWEAFCDMYKGSGPAILYMEEEAAPPPPPPPAEGEEKKKGEEKTAEAKGEEKAAGDEEEDDDDDDEEEEGEEGVSETKAEEATKKKDAKEGAGKEKNGAGGGEVAVEEEAAVEEPVADPTRWQKTELWQLDNSQARFLEKYNEKALPEKSPEERMEAMKKVWNSKKLRKEKADAAEEDADAEAKEGEEKKGGEEEKKEGVEEKEKAGEGGGGAAAKGGEEGAGEVKEDAADAAEEEDESSKLVDALLGEAAPADDALAAVMQQADEEKAGAKAGAGAEGVEGEVEEERRRQNTLMPAMSEVFPAENSFNSGPTVVNPMAKQARP